MQPLLLVLTSGALLLTAYLTYGRWLSRRIFETESPESDARTTPAHALNDNVDFVPTKRSILFGHHFTSIAGTGPIVGPAIAVMWGWLPAILWVVFGCIFVGTVHDLGSLVVSLRNKGRSIGDVAGDLLGPRVRLIFLCILIVGLWIVLAIFGLVIAAVLRTYPAAVTPVLIQIPLAIIIGLVIHRAGKSIFIPSLIALVLMYASVIWGDVGPLHSFNTFMAAQPTWIWTAALLIYCYIASVLPVWVLLQPRDYINALQLVSCLALITVGLVVAALLGGAADDLPSPSSSASSSLLPLPAQRGEGGASPGEGPSSSRPPLQLVAPMIDWQPAGAPPMLPVLFITIACGACSGFHCLVASGTTSKQVNAERDARPVAYGSMLTEGFLATLVIAACAAGIGLGARYGYWAISATTSGASSLVAFKSKSAFVLGSGDIAWQLRLTERQNRTYLTLLQSDEEDRSAITMDKGIWFRMNWKEVAHLEGDRRFEPIALPDGTVKLASNDKYLTLNGRLAFPTKYQSWSSSSGLANTVGAYVEGAANFLRALDIPLQIAIALMAVMVASFAATTLDTACRLQRYVIQEFASTFLPKRKGASCPACGYDLSNTAPTNDRYTCPECGKTSTHDDVMTPTRLHRQQAASNANPFKWLGMLPIATLVAIVPAFLLLTTPTSLTWPTSPTGAPVAFTAGLQQLLARVGSNGIGMWLLFGTVSHLLAGFGFIVIAAWLLAKGKPIWFLIPPAILTLGFSAWTIIWRALVGTGDTPSWWSAGNWTLVAIAVLTLVLEMWVVGESARRITRRRPA